MLRTFVTLTALLAAAALAPTSSADPNEECLVDALGQTLCVDGPPGEPGCHPHCIGSTASLTDLEGLIFGPPGEPSCHPYC